MDTLYPEELEAAKEYIREYDNDSMVVACVLGARAYLASACGISLPLAGSERRAEYDLVCHALAADAYDRRSTVINGTAVNENPVFRNMKNHLKLTEPMVSNLSAGDAGGEGEHGEGCDGGGAADPDSGIPSVETAG